VAEVAGLLPCELQVLGKVHDRVVD
jgi:hypothetical protein